MNCSFDSSQLIKEDHKLAPSPRLAASPEIVDMSWSFFWPSHSGFIKKLLIIEKLPNSSQQPDQWPTLFRRWALLLYKYFVTLVVSCNKCKPVVSQWLFNVHIGLTPTCWQKVSPSDWLVWCNHKHLPTQPWGGRQDPASHAAHTRGLNHQHCSV